MSWKHEMKLKPATLSRSATKCCCKIASMRDRPCAYPEAYGRPDCLRDRFQTCTLHKDQEDARKGRAQVCQCIQGIISRAMLAATHRSHQSLEIIVLCRNQWRQLASLDLRGWLSWQHMPFAGEIQKLPNFLCVVTESISKFKDLFWDLRVCLEV